MEVTRFSALLLSALVLRTQVGMASLIPTWEFQAHAPILSTQKVGDLDGDGTKEIILSTYS